MTLEDLPKEQRMRELVVVPVFVVVSATMKIELRGICSKICSITHWPNFNLNHIRMQLPLLGILSLSGYFFVKDKTDIRDQNLLIVKSIL